MSASNKSLLFFLGLVLGLLAGAGFFIFKMDDILKKVNVFSSSKKDTIIIQQQPNITEEKKNKTDIKKYIGKDTGKNSMNSAELLAQKYSREVPIKRVMAEADSLLKDSSAIVQNENTSENFIVRKDELLGTKNFQVVNLQNEESNPSDSLLEKVSGIKNTKSASSLKVEFWQSPINYKGYKMTKNKIVLYGINSDENIKLFHLEENVYMKHNQNFYKLYFTDEFKQFEKVTDASVIAKLK
ncbi:MAG: hypothetical protein HY063_14425 [Bacteroidetes bacterium]|nr:hypothetical protein [Bacteroidota bacterium]